jgi:A/G-specific adenine glycosylase
MDLGATICLPKNPRCSICPVMKFCKARENGTLGVRPVKKPKKTLPQYIHAAAVVIQRGKVLLVQRPSKGLLGGLWEFPNGRVDRDPARGLGKAIKSAYGLGVRLKRGADPVVVVEHTYSHFHVTVHAYPCELIAGVINGNFRWVLLKELKNYPMGKIDRQVSQKIK